ncbi:putative hydrolase or acyltransferase of alpha/beta superfamily [Frankia sp. EI5c]|uniref:alpha/beta hydrolase n=1 Tax=Frankia sp. EI5c TaxID=683316 RepID=UPI0007C28416|nr:alpha/beta hydrolase [Frankia sp. EI5c]OAA27447.1 putative hydrolase or acyltransferase of alpha/beta superfamily [Frankia sp. EI5c]
MRFLLIHGGTFDDRCWDRMRAQLAFPSTAVVQPGRGNNRPEEIRSVALPDYRETVAEAVRSTAGDLILVAHSLAGLSVTAGIAAAPERVRHVILLSCAVLPEGESVLSAIHGQPAPDVDADAALLGEPVAQTPELVARMAGEMSPEELAYTFSISVAEPGRVLRSPTTLTGWDAGVPATWVRLLRDNVFTPQRQTEMAARAGVTDIVDVDAGHLAMISRAAEIAAICNRVAARYATAGAAAPTG